MNQPVKVESKRADMPLTAKWLDERRREYGKDHVNDCIRRAIAKPATESEPERPGEPGMFYAMENGHVLGTPFPATDAMATWQEYALMCGVRFACFLARPEGGTTHGTD
jgi:hypothetical protein